MIRITAICNECGSQSNLSEEEECMWEELLKDSGWFSNDVDNIHLCETCNLEAEEPTNE